MSEEEAPMDTEPAQDDEPVQDVVPPPAGEVPPPLEEAPAPSRPINPVVPLGHATSKILLELDVKPFILDKMFHQGNMSRLDAEDSNRPPQIASADYEDYHWQLERNFREVPPDMSVGAVSTKPEALMYEEEKFILGKMERAIKEDADLGYVPVAAGRHESVLELVKHIESVMLKRLPPEPKPCRPPYIPEETCGSELEGSASATTHWAHRGEDEEPPSCFRTVTGAGGKIYEFSFAGITSLSLDPECSGGGAAGGSPSSVQTCSTAGGSAPPPPQAQGQGQGQCRPGQACKPNMKYESKIQAVCNAARNAMAVYDTVTSGDNFPCNLGDHPSRTNNCDDGEDNVWNWLYQLIFKMVPLEEPDANSNTYPRYPPGRQH